MNDNSKILNVSQTCKSYSPPKLRARILNAGKNLHPAHLRQWTDEIYPQYSESCGIAESLAPLVRSGRAGKNVVRHAATRLDPDWAKDVVHRVNTGDFLVDLAHGGKRSSTKRSSTKRSSTKRASRKTRRVQKKRRSTQKGRKANRR
jgi:hypothetical protein